MSTTRTTPLLTLADLSAVLCLPRSWLRAEAEAGRLPCLRVGHRLRFDREAVESGLRRRASGEEGNHAG